MKKFRRKSDGSVVTEFDLDPLCTIPSPHFRPNEEDYDSIRQWAHPDYDQYTQKVVEFDIALIDGIWTEQWSVTDLAGEELTAGLARKAADETAQRTALCAAIDHAADAARLLIVGDSVRVVEYQRAEAEATAYAAAGYTGTVPPTVQSWAEAKQWTAQAAADDILRASAAWNTALYALRDIRLKGKEAVKTAATAADAQAAAATAEAQIKAVLDQVAQ